MTAYAKAEKNLENLSASIEIRSYNSRHLDIALRLPHGYLPLEDKLKKRVAEQVSRGRLDIVVTIKDDSDNATAYEIDFPRAKAYHRALLTLKKALSIEAPLRMEHLLNGSGLLKPLESEKDFEGCWKLVDDVLAQCLEQLETMRIREGAFIEQDFQNRLSFIQTNLSQIETASRGFLELYRDRLTDRIAALTKGVVDLEPERITQEAAILADKSDISEEIVRVESHLAQFRSFMADSEPAGRKLNFLLQEFNREFNTMGSKAGKSEISHLIVEVKAELEKLREQVQNIE